MKKYKLILFLSTAFLSVACTDSFFDLEPSSSVPTDKVHGSRWPLPAQPAPSGHGCVFSGDLFLTL